MADDEDDGFTLSGWVQDGPQTPETMRAVAEHTKSVLTALREVPPEHMQNVIGSILCSVAVMYDQPVHFLMHAMTGAYQATMQHLEGAEGAMSEGRKPN